MHIDPETRESREFLELHSVKSLLSWDLPLVTYFSTQPTPTEAIHPEGGRQLLVGLRARSNLPTHKPPSCKHKGSCENWLAVGAHESGQPVGTG